MVRLVQNDRPRARNYSSRREQWRLFLLIVPLGLVIMLMSRLREPETANRINQFFAPVAAQQHRDPAPVADTGSSRPFQEIRGELLDTIRDNTYFRNAEQEAWFDFIGSLQRASDDQLRPGAGAQVDYTQLVDQPNVYRGRLVTVRGRVGQVTEQKPAPNELGVDRYYRIVMQPADGANWPIFLYALQLPPEWKPSEDLDQNIVATGLFFKNLSYSWQDGLGIAPVVVARSVQLLGAGAGDRTEPMASSSAPQETEPAAEAPAGEPPFRDVLALAGWTTDRLAKFDDLSPWTDDQRLAAVELLRRLRSFDSPSLVAWASDEPSFETALSNPAKALGRLFTLQGRVTQVAPHELSAADKIRLEMDQFYECELDLGDGAVAKVITSRVPRAWLEMENLDEPATAHALYFKRLPGDAAATVWIAKQIAWHPTAVHEPYVSFGKSILGTLGMDVGLLDKVRIRGRIAAAEAEPFYQMLQAAGKIEARQLISLAVTNLDTVRQKWQQELTTATDPARRNLAREVLERAAAGRYSVAPLFNDPKPHIGQLIVVDGVARRATRVEVDTRTFGAGNRVRWPDFDHYFEVEVFTGDSQNNPLVFCVRELPNGFPQGGSIHEPVRIAGFFLKDWLYQARGSHSASVPSDRRYAPLLIGRMPVVLSLQHGQAGSRLVLGGLLLLALAGCCVLAVTYARSDGSFRKQMLATSFSLPPGTSLNDLNLSPADEPIKEVGSSDQT